MGTGEVVHDPAEQNRGGGEGKSFNQSNRPRVDRGGDLIDPTGQGGQGDGTLQGRGRVVVVVEA